ncbi:MAG: hypothetical protein ACXVY8_01100 [Gaiellaceae bacterium]
MDPRGGDTRLDGTGSAELRRTLLYARRQPRPVSADDVAGALDVHRNVARSRLERLARAGLLEVAFERRSGRSGPGAGRPAKVYGVPPELEALEFPPRQLERLITILSDALPRGQRRSRLRRAGEEFGRALAETAGIRPERDPERGLAGLCAGLGSLGWQVSPLAADENGAQLATPTCPLRPLLQANGEAVEIDRGMWAGLTEAAFAGRRAVDVRCETVGCIDAHASCRIRLRFSKREPLNL